MAKNWLLLAAAMFALATPGCEDNPDQIYKQAPPGAGDRWNNGKTPGVWDPAKNAFTDNFNATSKQELCSGPVKHQRWAKMVNEPIIPPRKIAGIDLAGGDNWTGLDFRDAERTLCQSKSISGDETTLTASWGDADEVTVTYKLATNTIDNYQLNQGFRGKLEFESRPTSLDDPAKPNPFGKHTYSIGVGVPVLRDGKTFELNWKRACTGPDDRECWESQATEMFDALMWTYAKDLQSTQTSCIKAQTCLAKTFSTGDAVFGVRPLGAYLYVPSVSVPQPAASTPSYLYGFYVKLMPFSASEMFLKLDVEGPIAVAMNLGDKKVTCKQKLGMKYSEFLGNCINILNDQKENDKVKTKLLGGMSHDKEAFNFSIEGVNLDFADDGLGDFGTLGDEDVPEANEVGHEMEMDIRASGNVINEYAKPFAPTDGKCPPTSEVAPDGMCRTFTFGGTGAIYREYARRVQEDIHKQWADWIGTVNPGADGKCGAGFKLDGKSCQYQGFEIGDPACLIPAGADPASWRPAAGCTGFEQFVTPGSRNAGEFPNENIAKLSVGAKGNALGFKTALKAGDPIAKFCADPSPNVTGKDLDPDGKPAACQADTECWSNKCGDAGTDGVKRCVDVTKKYFKLCDETDVGFTGSLLDGSYKHVLDILGDAKPLNLPPALRDRKYYFKHWAAALVKYLKAAPVYPTDLGRPEFMPGGTACDGEGKHFAYGCEPEPDHLLFDQVGLTGDRDKFEYIDRRFVSPERNPLKVEYEILVLSSNQQEWKFHRRITRGERALYMALSQDRNLPPANSEDNVRITNIVGSPIIKGGGWSDTAAKTPDGRLKDAHYCASTLLPCSTSGAVCTNADQPDPDCKGGNVPPQDSHTGTWMLDDYGQPLLTNYRGAFKDTVFTMGSTHMKMVQEIPEIKSAKITIPFFKDPYETGGAGPDSASSTPTVLMDWRPKTPADGIRMPVNAQRDKFVPSATVNINGSSLDLDIDYEQLDDGRMRIQGVQSDNYQGNLFLCQDPNTGDILSTEQYESMEVIMSWLNRHPGSRDACSIIIRWSASGLFPVFFASKQAGMVLNIGTGSGVGRVTSIELYDTGLQ